MKKLFTAFVCSGLICTLSGCSLGTVLEQFTSTGDTSTQETASQSAPEETKSRVYMDEISGTFQNFSGNQISVTADEKTYVFDVSQATLECAEGLIAGNEICVIYEGQLSDTDTSVVKALKVVDEFHKKKEQKERTVSGQVLNLTPNTITIRTDKGNTLTCSTIGTEQYYQNGIKQGCQVYLHYKGKASKDSSNTIQNAGYLKVFSVSDTDPLKIPDPTPTPLPDSSEETPQEKEQQFLAVIQGVSQNILQIIPAGKSTVQNIDISAIPVYLKGGSSVGSHVNVTYKGELKEDTLEGITVLAVTGEDPDLINNRNISFTVYGTVLGTTANTVTIQTNDGIINTFRREDAADLSTGELSEGCSVRITFHPSLSKTSNIYTAIKIEDA